MTSICKVRPSPYRFSLNSQTLNSITSKISVQIWAILPEIFRWFPQSLQVHVGIGYDGFFKLPFPFTNHPNISTLRHKVMKESLNKSQTNRLIVLNISDLYAYQNIIIWYPWTLYTGILFSRQSSLHSHTDCFHRHLASPRLRLTDFIAKPRIKNGSSHTWRSEVGGYKDQIISH